MSVVAMKLLTMAGPLDRFDTVVRECVIEQDFHPENTIELMHDVPGLRPLPQDNPWAPLLRRAEDGLRAIDGVEVLGAPARRAGAVSFNLKGFHYYDTARLLDQLGIAVRSGHHCAQPLLERFGLTGAVRVTPAWYNTEEEIAALLRGVERVAALAGGLKA